LSLALIAPELRQAHGGAELPGFRLLLACNRERSLEIRLGLGTIGLWRHQRDFAGNWISGYDLARVLAGTFGRRNSVPT